MGCCLHAPCTWPVPANRVMASIEMKSLSRPETSTSTRRAAEAICGSISRLEERRTIFDGIFDSQKSCSEHCSFLSHFAVQTAAHVKIHSLTRSQVHGKSGMGMFCRLAARPLLSTFGRTGPYLCSAAVQQYGTGPGAYHKSRSSDRSATEC